MEASWFQISYLRFPASSIESQVSDFSFRFQVSSVRVQVSDFRLQLSDGLTYRASLRERRSLTAF
jgi:hypothetical protein